MAGGHGQGMGSVRTPKGVVNPIRSHERRVCLKTRFLKWLMKEIPYKGVIPLYQLDYCTLFFSLLNWFLICRFFFLSSLLDCKLICLRPRSMTIKQSRRRGCLRNVKVDQNPGWLGYIGEYTIYPAMFWDYFISHEIRLTINSPTSIMEGSKGFERCSSGFSGQLVEFNR